MASLYGEKLKTLTSFLSENKKGRTNQQLVRPFGVVEACYFCSMGQVEMPKGM